MANGMSNNLRNAFQSGPMLFPHMLDIANDRVLLAQISPEQFHQASFLDQRVYTEQMPRQWAPWQDVEQAGLGLSANADYIFHIGHVGSTLISRLLGQLQSVFALREPLLLRSLAEIGPIADSAISPWSPASYQARLGHVLGWLARSFDPAQKALIKASSFVSAIAGDIMQSQNKALFLTLPPERYIATILAGEASRQELSQISGPRLARLHTLIGAEPWTLWQLDEAQRAAMAWATEMTSLSVAAQHIDDDRILWMNFDAFLTAPLDSLQTIIRFFGYDAQPDLNDIINSPIMTRYSKAPEHDYSADLRRQLLAETLELRAADIRKALAWLEDAAAHHPAIAAAMQINAAQMPI